MVWRPCRVLAPPRGIAGAFRVLNSKRLCRAGVWKRPGANVGRQFRGSNGRTQQALSTERFVPSIAQPISMREIIEVPSSQHLVAGEKWPAHILGFEVSIDENAIGSTAVLHETLLLLGRVITQDVSVCPVRCRSNDGVASDHPIIPCISGPTKFVTQSNHLARCGDFGSLGAAGDSP